MRDRTIGTLAGLFLWCACICPAAANAQTRSEAIASHWPVPRGAYVRIDVAVVGGAHPSWSLPVQAYLKRVEGGWKLVGLDRTANVGVEP